MVFAYYEDLLGRINEQEFVAAATPVVKGFGLMTQTNADWNVDIEIMGIEPKGYSAVTGFANSLHYHRADSENALVPINRPGKAGCVAGIDLAPLPWRRNTQGEYNHSMTPPSFELVISSFPLTAKGALASADTNPASAMSFYYSDDSRTGLVRIDERMVYMSLANTTLIAVVVISAIAVSMAGAMLPTIQAARRKPIETLQVNQL